MAEESSPEDSGIFDINLKDNSTTYFAFAYLVSASIVLINNKYTNVIGTILLILSLLIYYLVNKYENVPNIVMAFNDTLGFFGNMYNQVRYGYIVSMIFMKDNEIYGDYIHRYKSKATNTWFYSSGTPIIIDGNEAIFVTGAQGQDDALLLYDKDENRMRNIIEGTGLSSKKATYGAVSIDLDKDGYVDLIVAREDGVTLYKNNKGIFKPIKIMDKQAGFTPIGLAVSDYDKDGNPDIFVSQFIDYDLSSPSEFDNPEKHAPNVMLKGIGNNKFKDVSKELGLDGRWNTFTSAFIDLNNDGWVDLVQSPDAARIYIHKNEKGKKFTEMPNVAGSGYWMGIATGDFDNDLDEDLFLTNMGYKFAKENTTVGNNSVYNANHILLRNDGNFKFVDITEEKNLIKHDAGWGAVFEDINQDGKQDLLFAQNVYFLPQYHVSKAPGRVMMQQDNTFKHQDKYPNKHFGQTPILVDVNKDGIKDIVWINFNGPVKVYLNKKENNYINVVLPDNLDFANATVTVFTKDLVQKKHHIIGGIGMAGDQSNMISFGLGKINKVDKIELKLLNGNEYRFSEPKINTTIYVKLNR